MDGRIQFFLNSSRSSLFALAWTERSFFQNETQAPYVFPERGSAYFMCRRLNRIMETYYRVVFIDTNAIEWFGIMQIVIAILPRPCRIVGMHEALLLYPPALPST